jgi:hypothetical protein
MLTKARARFYGRRDDVNNAFLPSSAKREKRLHFAKFYSIVKEPPKTPQFGDQSRSILRPYCLHLPCHLPYLL